MARAQSLGFDYVATGHYARIRSSEERKTINDEEPGDMSSSVITHHSSFELLRATDPDKDQSYMLHMLQQADLARLLFPIGDYSKAEVRASAALRGLSSADRPESQDICFVPGGDYRNLLIEERPDSLCPGPIVDMRGHELGRHHGLPLYTIGQRKGLGVATGEPLYVTGLDAARNALVVGPREALDRHTLDAAAVTFVSGQWPSAPFDCQVQIRSHAEPVAARVTPEGPGRIHVAFVYPQRAVTPGQAIVMYDGDVVLGGGRISA
jgi:tRNA-specific 2-thiouridylase